jgi:hypothetical protein
MSIASILVNVTIATDVLPLLAALYNYRRLDPVLKLFAAFCLVSASFDWLELVTSHFMSYLGWTSNYPLLHLFNLVAVLFFIMIYYRAFYESVFKKAALIFGAIALAAIVGNAIFFESIWKYPSASNTILCLFLIVLSLTYFYQLLTRQEFIHIEKQGLFWINSGVLFYFSINVFMFMLFNKFSTDQQSDIQMLQSVTNIIANVLYSVGLLCKPQKTT